MSQITHGEVMYGQTVNTGDYNSKKCEVKIGFSLAENASEDEARRFLDTASQVAISKCYELLALPKAKGAVAQVSTTAAPQQATAPAPAPAGKTKDQLAAEAGLTAAKTPRAKKPPKEEPDPAAMEDAPAQVVPKAEADPAAMVEDESLFGAAPAAAAKKITDEEITSAITRRNAVIKNPPAIRQLIGTFVAHPGQARDIPQERRQEFLDKLATLQPPAAA